ncbi:methyltransferase type 11 [Fischerella thermalis CCMEE 5282]|jgi:ubiquinone/menaquinone biosynthesis C-methylase UbiE|uniref:Methyltransferase type 11 n=1 Tax=Fischerella thermalis JSC-11 TaxID=741277 RepID=G6FSU4_9CYAN|nr:methyltransferase domain-containing protein [Fischerella thermalis]EHC14930.1 Methyltransferase type 11 [Fischerella thermalis JSC-11]PMB11284.1 methyltransferase type 11 [Fischerella thermalis CCMEE 5282]
MLKLNLGCGSHTPDGWLNVDYALGSWLAKLPVFSTINKYLKIINLDWPDNIFIYDLRKSFPWADNSVDVVYSSHTLEHFSRTEGQKFLTECYRVLKPNGIIRIVVPDLSVIVKSYLQGEIPAHKFLDALEVSYEDSADGFLKRKLAPFIRFPHKCMYDTNALLQVMSEIGFEVASKQGLESDIEDVAIIEQYSRTVNAVIVEGKKITDHAPKLQESSQPVSLVGNA